MFTFYMYVDEANKKLCLVSHDQTLNARKFSSLQDLKRDITLVFNFKQNWLKYCVFPFHQNSIQIISRPAFDLMLSVVTEKLAINFFRP